jgi:hypothetical protein
LRQRVDRAPQVPGMAGLIKVECGLATVLYLNGLRHYGG